MKVLVGLLLLGVALARQERCPANQHTNSCGSACPLTCDNFAKPPRLCVLMCVPGCHCDEGYVLTEGGQCVRPKDCPNAKQVVVQSVPEVCQLSAETGQCRALFIRYYFDKFSSRCKKFVFGGCGGNKNNFRSLEQCRRTCTAKAKTPNPDCRAKPDSGLCGTYMERFYYNEFEGRCKRFVYGGCGGNTNNFETEEECYRVCANGP